LRQFAAIVPLLAAFQGCGDAASESPPSVQLSASAPLDAGVRDPTAGTVSIDASVADVSTGSIGDASNDGDASALDAHASTGPLSCTSDDTFPATFAVEEASAAAEVELSTGVRELFVVGDSGHAGQGILIALPAHTTRPLKLPLDDAASDDLEGVAWRDGHLYTLTSSGAVRRFSPDGVGGVVRDQDAYALGVPPYVCGDLKAGNCGKDYEGLCLRAVRGAHACDGYAAAKAEGKLYCVQLDGAGKLGVVPAVSPIDLSLAADVLSDCAFGAGGGPADDVLVVTTNGGNFDKTYRVDEATAQKTPIATKFLLNNEAVAVDRDGALYVFDDHTVGPSGALRMNCSGW
jgi:hypothetical protein